MTAFSPLCVAIFSLIFACLVGTQYRINRRQTHLFWTISLVMSALGSFGYCISLWTSPHSGLAFQVYYLCGALWMPAVMGLGSLGLVSSQRVVWRIAAVVLVCGLVGSVSLLGSTVSNAALQRLDGGAGTGIIAEGAWLWFLVTLNTFGGAAVLIVATVSVWHRVRYRQSGRFVSGNISLAVGVLVISMAGSAARLGWPQLFWVTMLIGWVITFWGYRLLSPQSKTHRRAVEVAAR